MDPLTLPPRDWILIHVNSSHIQRKEHPTMASIRRIVTQWGRRIAGGLILALLFSQMALAMYACPKPDSAGHIASMQAAGMAMEDPVDMPSLPDCHAMSGTMDDEAPQLCRAHCDSDGQLVSSLQGLDTQSIAAHGSASLICFRKYSKRSQRPALWLATFSPTLERVSLRSISRSRFCGIETPSRARRVLTRHNT